MLELLDGHSFGERDHAERVAVYAVATGERLGMSDDDLLSLRIAAQLHDVGKVLVSPSILRSRKPLGERQLAALQRHPRLALWLLEPLNLAAQIVSAIEFHHERWDGGGYLAGLEGERIPLAARVIAVAEAFDAMTLSYPEAKRRSEVQALTDLQAQAGKQFDPAVVAAFLLIQPIIQPIGL